MTTKTFNEFNENFQYKVSHDKNIINGENPVTVKLVDGPLEINKIEF